MVKKTIKGLLLMCLLTWSTVTFAQSNNVRGFYLRNINTWIGNATSENTILSYAQGNGNNYIIFYDLGSFDF